jgi:hypothetical protein
MNKLSNLRLPNSTASSLAFLTLLSLDTAFAQNIVVPSGTAARAQLIKSSSVHNGQELSAKLMDSIYVGDKLVLPAGTLLQGNIVDLTADRTRRIRARLNGDFIPFHQSHVRFHSMTLPSGQTVQVETTQEMGPVVVRLMSPQNSGRAGPDVVFLRNTRLEIQLQPAKDKQEQGVESRKLLSQSTLQK